MRPSLNSDEKAPRLSLWMHELLNAGQVVISPVRRVKLAERARGGDQPVLVFPGIVSNDQSTSLLRRTLSQSGFNAHRSKLGFVTGVTPEAFLKAEERLTDIFERDRRKVVLLGWSLGGIYARILAHRYPERVAMVVTLGTPFSGNRRANNAWRLYEALNDHKVDAPKLPDNPRSKPPVHTVAIWSRNDGVIAPLCARGLEEERDVEIEVPYRHLAFTSNRKSIDKIIRVIRDQLPKMD